MRTTLLIIVLIICTLLFPFTYALGFISYIIFNVSKHGWETAEDFVDWLKED